MKTLLILLFGCLTGYLTYAQIVVDRQVIGSSGNYSTAGNLLISSNVGESATITATTGSFSFTQGFEQPDNGGSVGIADDLRVLVDYSFFPNPTDEVLYIEMNTTSPVKIFMEVYDATGRLTPVRIEPVWVNGPINTQADLSMLADGFYQLLLKNASGQPLHSAKIRKVH
ncbi:MAG: T9SS type A sorting domain-containing protein [Bacteroidia bacterium]